MQGLRIDQLVQMAKTQIDTNYAKFKKRPIDQLRTFQGSIRIAQRKQIDPQKNKDLQGMQDDIYNGSLKQKLLFLYQSQEQMIPTNRKQIFQFNKNKEQSILKKNSIYTDALWQLFSLTSGIFHPKTNQRITPQSYVSPQQHSQSDQFFQQSTINVARKLSKKGKSNQKQDKQL